MPFRHPRGSSRSQSTNLRAQSKIFWALSIVRKICQFSASKLNLSIFSFQTNFANFQQFSNVAYSASHSELQQTFLLISTFQHFCYVTWLLFYVGAQAPQAPKIFSISGLQNFVRKFKLCPSIIFQKHFLPKVQQHFLPFNTFLKQKVSETNLPSKFWSFLPSKIVRVQRPSNVT